MSMPGSAAGGWVVVVSGGGWVVVVVGGSVTGGAAVVGGSVGAGCVVGAGAGVVGGGGGAAVGGGGGSVLGSGSGVTAGSVVGGRVPERELGRVVVVVVARRFVPAGAGATEDESIGGAGSVPATPAVTVEVAPAVVGVATVEPVAVVPVAGLVVLGARVVDTVLTCTDGDGLGWVAPPPDDGTCQTIASTPSATSSPAMTRRATRRRLRGRSVRSS
jgi:hypothetical protein